MCDVYAHNAFDYSISSINNLQCRRHCLPESSSLAIIRKYEALTVKCSRVDHTLAVCGCSA